MSLQFLNSVPYVHRWQAMRDFSDFIEPMVRGPDWDKIQMELDTVKRRMGIGPEEAAIVQAHTTKPVVYIAQVGPLFKYGSTHRLESRFITHKCHHHKINNDFRVVFAIETSKYRLVERALGLHVRNHGRDRCMQVNGTNQVEFMELDDSFSLDHVKEKLRGWVSNDHMDEQLSSHNDHEQAVSLLIALGFNRTPLIQRSLLKTRFIEWSKGQEDRLIKGKINNILQPLGVRITIAFQNRAFVDGKQTRDGTYKLEPLPSLKPEWVAHRIQKAYPELFLLE
ncbi:hypothetical protein HK102_008554, partial [Quaeritorhiza haematococci]